MTEETQKPGENDTQRVNVGVEIPNPITAPRVGRKQDEAMAESSPDFNKLIASIGRYLLKPIPGDKVNTWFRTGAGMWIISLMIFFVVGLPAINGATIFFQTLGQSQAQDREFQLKMFSLQTDLEIRKLDRTMLGDGAMKTLTAISEQLQAQGETQRIANEKMDKLTVVVDGLVRKTNAMSSEQSQMRERMQTARPPPR